MEGAVDKTRSDRLPLVALPLAAVLLHVLCINNYGYFRDELYYLACAQRLDWGYVDHPPFSVALLRLVTLLFGDSLAAIRAPIALASGLTVFTVMVTARRLGARGFGTWLAGLSVLLSGMYLVIFSFYTMNALDILIWAVAAYLVVRLIESESPGLWLLFGAIIGMGFLNKVSILWLVVGLGLGLLASPQRRMLAKPWPWLGLLIVAVIAVPHTLWEARNGWPTTEFVTNALKEKLVPISPWDFFLQQAVVVNIAAIPMILGGIVYGLRAEGRKWVALPVVFLTVLLILLVNGRSRINYIAPAYPFVLSLGAVAVQKWFEKKKWKPVWAYAAFTATTPLYVTLGLPWLSPESMTWLINKSPIQPPVEEKGPKSQMQGWADMFGWPELARDVEAQISKLPQADRSNLVVVTKNYGEAAALQHYTSERVICGHNNYYLWGVDGWDGRVAVFVNQWPPEVTEMFESFEQVGEVDAPYAVPEQNGSPIWVARGLKVPVAEFFRRIRKYV